MNELNEATPEMQRAGGDVISELEGVVDHYYLAARVYEAMEEARIFTTPQNITQSGSEKDA